MLCKNCKRGYVMPERDSDHYKCRACGQMYTSTAFHTAKAPPPPDPHTLQYDPIPSAPADDAFIKQISEKRDTLLDALIGESFKRDTEQATEQASSLPPHPKETIHVLYQGSPLCRFTSDRPVDWPKGHTWIPLAEDMEHVALPSNAACKACFMAGTDLYKKLFK